MQSQSSAAALRTQFEQGLALHRAGKLAPAAEHYRTVLAADPRHAGALHMLGVVHQQQGRADQAVAFIRRSLAIDPGQVEAHANLGLALTAAGDLQAAYESYTQALALKPDHGAALIGRGAVLRDLDRSDEALADLEAAVRLLPASPLAAYGRGQVLKDHHRLADALADLRRAVALAPDLAEAHVALAEALFLHGDAAAAWPEYEWRWRTAGMTPLRREFAQAGWQGAEPVHGKTILIHAEQGLGDTIQFCRYAAALTGLGARVLLEVPAELEPLMSSLADVQVLVRGQPLPAFDTHCPLLSLPPALMRAGRADMPPAPYLGADAARLAAWRARLGAAARPRVGLAWAGRPSHANDRNRSLRLDQLRPLFAADAEFVALQKDMRAADAAAMAGLPQLRALGGDLRDFADTAAVVAQLDLVIAVDTAVAHLAGALGKPVWILLPFVPDWRWGLDRERTPWYGTARLFRQTRRGDWEGVLARVAAELKAWLE